MDQPMTDRVASRRRRAAREAGPTVDQETVEVTAVICVVLAAAMMITTLVFGSVLAGGIGLMNLALASAMTRIWHALNP